MRRAKQFIQELKFKTSSLEKQNERLREIIISLPGGAERLQDPTSVPSPPETSTDSILNYSSPGTQLLAVSLLGMGGFHLSSSDSYENYSDDDFSLYSLTIFFILLAILCFTLYKIILAISRLFKHRPKASSTTSLISPCQEVPAVFLVPCLIKESIELGFSALYCKLSSPAKSELELSPGQIYHGTRDFIMALEGLKETLPWVYTVTQCMRFMIQLLKLQLNSDKPLRGEIYSSLGLLLQTCFRRSFPAVKMAKYYFKKASTSSGSTLLSQAKFFKWLCSEDAASVCRPVSCDSISGRLCDAFYLSKVEKLSIAYLSKPDSAPSLQDLFSEVNSNPLISERSSCFAAILLLETCLAFLSGKPQYGIKFSFSLIQLLTKYPDMLAKKDSLTLKGLFGCALSRPGPHQNVNASASFLDISLVGSRDASATPVLDFLTLHLIFTQRLALFISSPGQSCPESLTKALATLRLSLKSLRSHAAKYDPDQDLCDLHNSLVELASFYTVASKKISLCVL
ncbi:hypothetical protein DSO57_1027933 [Entomophthora muscae]|uniref:Uncharacterized protein n=1 Tax=Entomophthora muscae TaxID=34485 RepID=A0ACC2SEM3_9FUNG|nr:hypothetical protein DSO57_1027933 [Entomophthora muscae]